MSDKEFRKNLEVLSNMPPEASVNSLIIRMAFCVEHLAKSVEKSEKRVQMLEAKVEELSAKILLNGRI